MKKDNEIVAKPIVKVFLVGFTIKDMIEGILAKVDPKKQKNSSVCFEK
jgi:hypothetical protein